MDSIITSEDQETVNIEEDYDGIEWEIESS
ncbi:MAG: hypothetical protein RLZZ490_1720, partial [Cyanobacteriota bacterium]